MKSAAEKENKLDPRVPVLAGVLVLALAGAGISWRLSQAPAVFAEASAEPAKPAATSAQQMSDEAARLLASIAASQAEDAEVLETNWPAVQPPKAAPVAAAQPEERTFRLRGIIRGGVQPVVFLNDKTLVVGEEIDGYTLTEIAADHVMLASPQGKQIRLSLGAVE